MRDIAQVTGHCSSVYNTCYSKRQEGTKSIQHHLVLSVRDSCILSPKMKAKKYEVNTQKGVCVCERGRGEERERERHVERV